MTVDNPTVSPRSQLPARGPGARPDSEDGRPSIATLPGAPYRTRQSERPSPAAIDPQSQEGRHVLRDAIRRLSQHTFTYALAEQLSRLAGFFLIPLYTGYLTEADYGTRELFAITIAVLVQLAGINITTAMHRTYFEGQDPVRRKRVVSTTLWTVVGVAGTLAVLLGLAAPQIVPLFPSDYSGLDRLWLFTLGIFFFSMTREVFNKYLQAEERSVLYSSIAFSKLIVEIGLQILFLVALGWGIEGLFGAVLLSEVLFSLVLAVVVLPKVGLGFSRPVLLALVAFTLPLVPSGVFQFCLHSSDRYLLGWLTQGTEQVGIYGLAYKLGYVPNYLVLTPFLLVWYPFLFSVDDERKQALICGRLLPVFMLVMTCVVFLLSIFSQDIVQTMARRPGYHDAWMAIPIISLGYWFWSMFHMSQSGFYVKKITAPVMWLSGAAVVVNVYLNLVLIPLHGFMGAAIATALTFGALVVATLAKSQELFPLQVQWRKIFLPMGMAAVLYAGVLMASDLPDPWPAASKAMAVAIWLGSVWAGGFLDREERVEVQRLAAKALGRGPSG
jgi:O-antigen/teichoic acid export membrane protein